MSRKGNCWDNAVAESFFKTLKTEAADEVNLRKHYKMFEEEYTEIPLLSERI
jgi:transposase InsO family protein